MSTTHTTGPLHVGDPHDTIVYASDGWAVCNATVSHHRHGGPEVARANARRIVACWNALQAFPTGQIERLAVDLLALMAEREKLHAALEMARNGLAWYLDTYPAAVNGCGDEAMTQIDAALAGRNPDNLASKS